MIMDKLFDAVIEKRNPSVLGVDTQLPFLPKAMADGFDPQAPFESAAQLMKAFNFGLIDALSDVVPAIKLQSAFYELYGHDGVRTLQQTIDYAKKKNLIVIVDGKRDDIGSSAEGYAKAYLSSAPFPDNIERKVFDADILTVNGYLGIDGIQPFIEAAETNNKGVFILVKTSNPSSGQLQDLKLENGNTVYETMADLVKTWGDSTKGKHGYSAIGAVVGATYPLQGKQLRERLPDVPFLVPGYGAQGGKAEDLAEMFDKKGLGAVVNASRSLMCAHMQPQGKGKPYDVAAHEEALRMKADILSALEEADRLSY